MSAYWVAVYKRIDSDDKLMEYAVLAKEAVIKYSGKFLVRGGDKRTNEGDDFIRTVIVEFPNYKTAIKCYDSEEYQKAHKILEGHAERSHQIIEGS